MQFLIGIFAGFAAGWTAGERLGGKGCGPLMDLTMGVAGAGFGGVLTRLGGFSSYSGTLRKAVTRILGELRGRKFNSLEVNAVVLKRFVGLAFATITANRRYIQDGLKVSA